MIDFRFKALEEKAKAISGVMQWPYLAVAKSLEVISSTLIQNCGGNTIRTLTALRVRTFANTTFANTTFTNTTFANAAFANTTFTNTTFANTTFTNVQFIVFISIVFKRQQLLFIYNIHFWLYL